MADTFTPHLNGLRHQRPGTNGAAAWLSSLYGEPFSDARFTLFANQIPAWTEPKGDTNRNGAAFLSTLWDDIGLLTWCDGSTAIAWPSRDGFHVLPASFALANQIYPHTHKDTPYNERTNDGLRLWTTQNGLLWVADGIDTTAHQVEAMVRAWVWERVEEVKAELPVLDPRVHTKAIGGRFAPFSPFPKPNGAVLAEVEMLLTAACHLSGCDHIWATRASAPSPWKTGNTSAAVRGSKANPSGGLGHMEMSKSWRSWLKAALFGEHGIVPASMRVGMEAVALCEVRAKLGTPQTAHEKMAHMASLRGHQDTIAACVHPALLDTMPRTHI
jgi:hypothetical protein